MVSINVPSNNNRISITTGTGNAGMSVSLQDMPSFVINKAKDWAEKMDGPIGNEGYSSKWHATQSAQSATEAQEYAEQAESFKNELLNDTGFVAVKDNINSIITNAVNIEDINTVAENIDDIADASLLAKEFVEIWEAGVANNDLSNLTEQGEKHFLNKQQITNCLLEVPQTVIYETTDNSITIKVGSIGIVPNGAGVFNRQIFTNDLSYTLGSTTTGTYLVFKINNILSLVGIGRCSSGATNVNAGLTYSAWYDTTNNIVKRYGDDTTNYSQGSLPLMKVTCDSGEITSIDQIFNGMGYIGSTIWVDKGVKGLIPNGRNKDGSLKNVEARTESVLTYTNNVDISLGRYYSFKTPVNGVWTGIDYKGINALNTGTPTSNWYFSEEENKWLFNGNELPWLDFALSTNASASPYAITSFNPKFPFRAVDYNDYTKDLDAKVNKSGDTMTGELTMNASLSLRGANNDIDYTSTTAPASDKHGGWVYFRDKNRNVCGQIFNAHIQDGAFVTRMQARRSIGGTIKSSTLTVGVQADGTDFFNFPKCTTSPSTTSSASYSKVAVVVENYRNGTSGLTLWSDGRLEQWGIVQCTSAGQQNTITFLKPYLSDRGYTLVMAQERAAAGDAGFPVFHTPYATGFTIIGDSTSYVNWLAIGYV